MDTKPILISCPVCDLPMAFVPPERATAILRTQMQDQHSLDCQIVSTKLPEDQVAELTELANKYLR